MGTDAKESFVQGDQQISRPVLYDILMWSYKMYFKLL